MKQELIFLLKKFLEILVENKESSNDEEPTEIDSLIRQTKSKISILEENNPITTETDLSLNQKKCFKKLLKSNR